jgi:hypothetical protein
MLYFKLFETGQAGDGPLAEFRCTAIPPAGTVLWTDKGPYKVVSIEAVLSKDGTLNAFEMMVEKQ